MANHFCTNSVEEQVNYLIDKVKGLNTNKLDKTAVVQETGTGTDVVMSQKAVTDAIAASPDTGLGTLTDVNLTLGNTTVQYDTTDGIQINSTARFTDAAGNHDAMMDLALPVVGKNGIIIDKAADSEKIEVKVDARKIFNITNISNDKSNFNRIPYLPKGKTSLSESDCYLLYVDDGNINDIRDIPSYVNPEFGDTTSSNGVLITSTPTKPYQAANKKYVDDAIASITSTTQTKYQHNLVLEGIKGEFTFKAFLSISRSDEAAFGTFDEVITAIGSLRFPCTGYVYDGAKFYSIYILDGSASVFNYLNPDLGEQELALTNNDVTVTDDPIEF